MDDTVDTLDTGLDASTQHDAASATGADGSTTANDAHTDPGASGDDGASGEGGADGEVEFQFGDEVSPASESQDQHDAPVWVKELRKRNAELVRQNRELEAKTKQQQPQPAPVPKLGPRPKLEDFDYDEGKLDAALDKWFETKRQIDAAQAEQEKVVQSRQRAIEERQNSYRTEAATLPVKNFRELEDEVVGALSVEQQGILLAGADKPALLVAALGRFPNKLKTLAEIKDPVRFAFAAGKLEKELKMTTRTATKAAPEGRVSSSSGVSAGGSERKLEQLRAEAEKTGDYSRVHAYKRQLKAGQRK